MATDYPPRYVNENRHPIDVMIDSVTALSSNRAHPPIELMERMLACARDWHEFSELAPEGSVETPSASVKDACRGAYTLACER